MDFAQILTVIKLSTFKKTGGTYFNHWAIFSTVEFNL